MRTDESRFRFLNEHRLSSTWTNDGCSLYWRGQDRPGHAGGFVPIAKGRDLPEATDLAIARWERKHKARWT
jgi:hypothetical protein